MTAQLQEIKEAAYFILNKNMKDKASHISQPFQHQILSSGSSRKPIYQHCLSVLQLCFCRIELNAMADSKR